MPPVIFPRVLPAAAWLVTLGFFACLALVRRVSVGEGDASPFVFYGVFAAGCLVTAALFRSARWPISPKMAIALVAPFFVVALFAHPPANTSMKANLVDHFKGFTSDDYHRFLLDGELIVAGENPYHVVPAEIPDH